MKKLALLFVTMSLALTAGCSKGPVKQADTSKPIIKINSSVITQNMFDKTLQSAISSSPFAVKGMDVSNPKNKFMYMIYKDRTVNELIVKEIINQEANKRKISVTDKDIDKGVDEIAAKLGGRDKMETSLTLNNIKMDDLKNNIKMDITVRKLIENIAGNVKISDKEAKNFYESNKAAKFTNPDQVRASHILISTDTNSNAKNAQAKAEKILAEVKANPSKFSEIASKNSDDPTSAQRGGDLGFFSKKDMVPAFSKAAFSMTPGTISGLVKTQFGFHIIKVTDRKNAGITPFSDVKDEITKYLTDRKKITVMQKLIDSAKSTAKIVYLDPQYNPNTITEEIKKMAKQKNLGLMGMPREVKGK